MKNTQISSENLRKELQQMLSESIAAAKIREENTFDELCAPFETTLFLFGAGNLGRKTLRGLRSAGVEPLGFIDNNSELWGKEVDGLRVFSPEAAAASHADTAAFVVTIWRGEGTDTMAERMRPLVEYGCKKIVSFGSLYWKYPQFFLPHYSFDLPHKVLQNAQSVMDCFDLWSDPASQYEYVAQIRWRLHLDFDGLPRPVAHTIYFPDDLFSLRNDEVFVDCGAFDGDTLRCFLARSGADFKHVYAFEADPVNFKHLQEYVSNLPLPIGQNMSLYSAAAGGENKKVYFNATGTESSAVGDSGIPVDCLTIDSVATDPLPTFIKMDIEGSELDALYGAQQSLLRASPVAAICVYHQQDHIWQIPAFLHACNSGYKFFLRPHLLESWDLLCYAVPNNRLLTT